MGRHREIRGLAQAVLDRRHAEAGSSAKCRSARDPFGRSRRRSSPLRSRLPDTPPRSAPPPLAQPGSMIADHRERDHRRRQPLRPVDQQPPLQAAREIADGLVASTIEPMRCPDPARHRSSGRPRPGRPPRNCWNWRSGHGAGRCYNGTSKGLSRRQRDQINLVPAHLLPHPSHRAPGSVHARTWYNADQASQ